MYEAVSDRSGTRAGRLEGFKGRVLRPGDPGFDRSRRVFDAATDKRPALIAECRSVIDVAAAVRYGVQEGFEIAIRGGGHSLAGTGVTDGGVVIDLRVMNGVAVDPVSRTVRVSGGATWADVDRACQPHGLAVTGGRVPGIGVAGHTLGGGSGWLERKYGLSCDSLLSVDLVTVSGQMVTADERSHAELFWALHGGGGNFGVVTSLTLRLHPVTTTSLALMWWPAETGADVLRTYREVLDCAPPELGGAVVYLSRATSPFAPEGLRGRPVVAVIGTYVGAADELRNVLAPLAELAPRREKVTEVPYVDLQAVLDRSPGSRVYSTVEHLNGLPDAVVDLIHRRAGEMPLSSSQLSVLPGDGMLNREASHWPLPYRRSAWTVHPLAIWDSPDDDDANVNWAQAFWADLEPHATGAVNLNLTENEGRARLEAGFGRLNYERLVSIKEYYDLGNVFRLNHNIVPS